VISARESLSFDFFVKCGIKFFEKRKIFVGQLGTKMILMENNCQYEKVRQRLA
jgi:hypothetical protein